MDDVLKVLDRLIELHEALLTLGGQKRPVIVANQVTELTQITQRESKLVKEIGLLETERVKAVQAYLGSSGIFATAAMTISDFIRFVHRLSDKEALQSRQQRLVELIGELKRVNELNRQLLEQSLSFVNYSIDLMVGPDEQESTYRHPEQQDHGGYQRSMFDRKA
ncbi:flagellar protein FlgN [Paenibacillus koleovorans]|uniref:flagellar protein FlgN n=1 Tax=Paenibacillus koleovorans TaxID=121608 RepID=UPI000FDBC2D9|nr:flagellar protein FlgN [Paenibacillus koleovorans]